jgi:hypothetical protein
MVAVRGQRTAAMHGKLALYHPQYGVIPIAVSLLAIIWTTVFLTWLQIYLVADDVEDLALAYLLPTIFIAVFFGSTLAIAGSTGFKLANQNVNTRSLQHYLGHKNIQYGSI